MNPKRPPTPEELAHARWLMAQGPNLPAHVVGETPPTFPEGVTVAVTRPREHDPASVAARSPKDLRDLLSEYHLFQHAALVLCGGLRQDPIALHWAEKNLPVSERPLHLPLTWPLAIGRIPDGLAREFFSVYACPKPHWPGLATALGLISGMGNGRRWDCLRQDLEVPALTQLVPAEVLSCPFKVKLSLYGLEGTDGTVHFLPPPAGRSGPLRLIVSPPARKDRPLGIVGSTGPLR